MRGSGVRKAQLPKRALFENLVVWLCDSSFHTSRFTGSLVDAFLGLSGYLRAPVVPELRKTLKRHGRPRRSESPTPDSMCTHE